MNSKILSLLLAFLLAAWMAPPLGAQGVKTLAVDYDPGGTPEDEIKIEQAQELQEKRMDAAGLLNMVGPPADAEVEGNKPENDVRALAEQAVSDDDPVVSYYGAVALALLDGLALPPLPMELVVEKEPVTIPAGVSFTEPSEWEAFLINKSELQSESVNDRLRAINGLINLAHATRPGPAPEVVFELQALLADEEPYVAQMASYALNVLVPSENRLPDTNAIGRLNTDDELSALADASLADKEPQVAQMAARALDSLVPSENRLPITKALGRLNTEDELFALVDASLGDGGESLDQRLQAMEALLEAAMKTPLVEDPELLRAFETSATDPDPRIAYFAQLALHGGLAGDPDALAGTWVAPVDAYRQAEFSDQPPSFNDDAPVQKQSIEPDGTFTGVYVNPEPQSFEPGDQPPSPEHREEIATYEEVSPGVWVNTAPPQRDPEMQQQPE